MDTPKLIFTGINASELEQQSQEIRSNFEDIRSMADQLNQTIDKTNFDSLRIGSKDVLTQLKKINAEGKIRLNISTTEYKLLQDIKSRNINLNQQEADAAEELIDRIQEELELKNEILNKTKEQAEADLAFIKQHSLFAKTGEYVKGLLEDTIHILKDPILAAGIFSGFVAKHASELASTTDKIRMNLGLSGDQSLQMGKNLTGAAAQGMFLGIGFEKTAAAAEAISEHNANLSHSTSKQIKQVAYMADRYGVSAESAAHLLETTQQLSNYNKTNANELIKSYAAIANAYNVTRGAVMKDMAQNAEFLALHTKNGAANIATASAAMQSLGMNLGDVNAISSKLLDIEGSINAEMQASVFLGKNLNLARARELAFAGDYDKMLTEIGSQLPTINQWENLNLVQRQKVAEAYGLSADRLFQMIGEQQNINKLHKEESSIWGDIYMWMTGAIKMGKEYGGLLASAGQFAFSLLGNWKGISETVGGIKDKVGGLFGKAQETVTDKLTDTATDKLTEMASNKAETLATSALGEGRLTKAGTIDKRYTKGLRKAGEKLPDIPLNASEGASQMTETFKGAGMNMANILKGATAFAIMSVGLIGIAAALKIAEGVSWQTVGIMGASLLGLTIATAAIGKLVSNPAVAEGIVAGALAFGILGASLIPLAYALNLMAPGLEVMKGLADPTVVGGLFLASGAIVSLATSISMLSLSLLTLLPMLPVLAAVKAFGLSDDISISSSSTSTQKNDDLSKIKDLLQDIKTSIDKGHNIYLDGKKVGNSLNINAKQQYALNPA